MKIRITTLATLFCAQFFIISCGHTTDKAKQTDSTQGDQVLPRPSSNSDATNPSIPDTALVKHDAAGIRRDTNQAVKK